MKAQIIEVIVVEGLERGDGTLDKPYRHVTQYFSKDGELLAEKDPYNEDRKCFINS